jgi:hypothetical protein
VKGGRWMWWMWMWRFRCRWCGKLEGVFFPSFRDDVRCSAQGRVAAVAPPGRGWAIGRLRDSWALD